MKPLVSVNPYTLQEIATYEPHTTTVWQHKLAEAATVQQYWKRRSHADRLFCLLQLRENLLQSKEFHAQLIVQEMGKLKSEALAEIEKCAALCAYYESTGLSFLSGRTITTDAHESGVFYDPLGVVLGIMPWNFPYWQAFRFLVPALLAGNAVVLKHASNVSGCALAIEQLFTSAGFPPACMQTLLLPGAEVLEVLKHPLVAAVSITGSEAAGQQVAMQAAALFKPAVLELGGSDPFIVFNDANIEAAVSVALISRFQNSGQSCIAAKRFLIQKQVYDHFIETFISKVEHLRWGNPALSTTTLAPLAKPAFAAELHQQVQTCLAMGAELITGGGIIESHPSFYQPTILTNISYDMPAAREELFGPVAAIMPFEDADEAIALANGTRFGLGSTVFTFNEHLIDRCKNELQTGSVFVNGLMKSHPALPFGGIKASGYGRELGMEGVMAFCNPKTYWIK